MKPKELTLHRAAFAASRGTSARMRAVPGLTPDSFTLAAMRAIARQNWPKSRLVPVCPKCVRESGETRLVIAGKSEISPCFSH